MPEHPSTAAQPQRDPACVERWPECESGAYDPRCCRFPKSCSCTSDGVSCRAQRLLLPDFASLTTEEIFDMVREYRGAPSNTASAMTVDQWREAWLAEWQRANRAEVAADEIMAALRSMRELASVAHNGDPWYAENEGLDAGAIFKQAREALGEPDA